MTLCADTQLQTVQCPVCNQPAVVTNGIVRGHRDTANHRCYMVGKTAPDMWEIGYSR